MFTNQRTGDVDGFSAELPAQVEDAGDSFSHLKLNTLPFLHNSFSLQLCINQLINPPHPAAQQLFFWLWHCINLSNLLNPLHNGDSFSNLKFNIIYFLHNSFSLQL
jgi:hypothetical protein